MSIRRVCRAWLPPSQILIGERCVLHTLGFQLSVEHPYSTVMYFLKMLFAQGKGADGGRGADKALNRQLTQVLWVEGFHHLRCMVSINIALLHCSLPLFLFMRHVLVPDCSFADSLVNWISTRKLLGIDPGAR